MIKNRTVLVYLKWSKKMTKIIIRCEKCSKSVYCMILKPCKDFTPEQSSNFLKEVVLLASKQETETPIIE